MTAYERRLEILELILVKRKITLVEIQESFGVSQSTAWRDIQELSRIHPIFIIRGRNGCAKLMDGYRLGKVYLNQEQKDLLVRLVDELPSEDARIVKEIIQEFSMPIDKKDGLLKIK